MLSTLAGFRLRNDTRMQIPAWVRRDYIDKVRVLVADDQELLREAYRLLLPTEPAIELVGVMGVDDGIINAIPTLNPKVLVIGTGALHPALMDEVALIRQAYPQLGLVLLLPYESAEAMTPNRSQGGVAYLIKNHIGTIGELTRAILSVAEGRVIMDASVAHRLNTGTNALRTALSPAGSAFTPRELEILGFIAHGYRNGSIARSLCLELKTVEHHISNIFSKMEIDAKSPYHARVNAVLTFLKLTGQLQQKAPEATMPLLGLNPPYEEPPWTELNRSA